VEIRDIIHPESPQCGGQGVGQRAIFTKRIHAPAGGGRIHSGISKRVDRAPGVVARPVDDPETRIRFR
jgi:hypothetical protein